MLGVLSLNLLSFILIFVGTTFFLVELLTKFKGVGFIIGLITYSLFFYANGPFEYNVYIMFLMLLTLFFGLIYIDAKIINDGLLSFIGFVSLIYIFYYATDSFSIGSAAAAGTLLGIPTSFIFLKFMPRRDMWSKIIFEERMNEEYSSVNSEYIKLVGKEGVTKSVLKPTGVADIDGFNYSVTSNGKWVEAGITVKVLEVDGTKILVEEKKTL